jgi:hypothetical protein
MVALFLVLKGMTGALAPFSYLLLNILANLFAASVTKKSFKMVTPGATNSMLSMGAGVG